MEHRRDRAWRVRLGESCSDRFEAESLRLNTCSSFLFFPVFLSPSHYCPIATSTPYSCSPGTYNPSVNATTDGSIASSLAISVFPACLSCTAGNECPVAGMSTVSPCSAGTYSPAGSVYCLPCKKGYYCDVGSMTDVSILSKPCPVGYYCAAGQSSGTVNQCQPGTYCPLGSSAPLNCPIGTYNGATGSSSLNACLTCTAGSYCTEGRSGPDGLCQPGFYCPVGSSSPREVPCPAGQRAVNPGTTSAAACTACLAGSYCE